MSSTCQRNKKSKPKLPYKKLIKIESSFFCQILKVLMGLRIFLQTVFTMLYNKLICKYGWRERETNTYNAPITFYPTKTCYCFVQIHTMMADTMMKQEQ